MKKNQNQNFGGFRANLTQTTRNHTDHYDDADDDEGGTKKIVSRRSGRDIILLQKTSFDYKFLL